ncbi:hypothetical protein CTAYLR_010481 [Chrysophaeum taylorii]|uniref:Methyltransferase domain-containing protein n=1 Tax=Chrysophaeum taylorii TaxID=2483200 RepID=A0AAD7XQN7_9STRA|nr:hypothetical protein CTAYLR_010481 [Chrysophaeum taylorii]
MRLHFLFPLVLGIAPPPPRVGEFGVEAHCSVWSGQEVCCLTVSSDPNLDGLHSVTHPEHPMSRALAELEDPHGVLGVWPSSFLAAACVGDARSVIELGCGAALPSLVASVVGGARVLATDVEDLPLRFLRAARDMHSPTARFETRVLDVRDTDPALLIDFDCVVAADLLYSPPVATALGACLAEALSRKPSLSLVVCDPGRRGRPDFLAAFDRRGAHFRDTPVPPTSPGIDIFDGTPQPTVGLLQY